MLLVFKLEASFGF